MNITISGHHVEVTPTIRSYVQSKLDRMDNLENVIDISVLLAVNSISEKEKSQRADVTLNMSGKTLHAESLSQDLYAAIDLVMDKINNQVIKQNSKSRGHSRESLKNMPIPAEE